MDSNQERLAGHAQRIAELESQITDLEAALDYYVHDREAATRAAIRNQVDVARFGAGAVLKALPRAIRQSLTFRVHRARHTRKLEAKLEGGSSQGNAAITQDAWTALAPIPTPKVESSAAVVGAKLYVFTGFGHGERFDPTSWSFDRESNRWQELPPMPLALSHAGVGVVGDEVWLVGGFVGNNGGPPSTHVQIFNVVENTWRDGPSLPRHRASLAAAVVGTRLHVVGGVGLDRKTDVTDHFVFDTADPDESWQAAAPLPQPGRNHLPAAVIDGTIYVAGGQRGLDGPQENLKVAHAYEEQSDTWRRIADLPFERHHCETSTFVWNGRMVVAGGLGPWQVAPLAEVVSYSPTDDAWSVIGSLPTQVWGSVVQRVDDEIIMTSGATETNGGVSAATWSHSLVSEPGRSL